MRMAATMGAGPSLVKSRRTRCGGHTRSPTTYGPPHSPSRCELPSRVAGAGGHDAEQRMGNNRTLPAASSCGGWHFVGHRLPRGFLLVLERGAGSQSQRSIAHPMRLASLFGVTSFITQSLRSSETRSGTLDGGIASTAHLLVPLLGAGHDV